MSELESPDIWWRPNGDSNSVGNLVLHLCGNARQWIMYGVLGEDDIRDRDVEFSTAGGLDPAELNRRLTETASVLDRGFERLVGACRDDPEYLGTSRIIQGMSVTVLEAVYHVVEHFAQHTGQIIYITKLRAATDLQFWKVEGGTAEPNW